MAVSINHPLLDGTGRVAQTHTATPPRVVANVTAMNILKAVMTSMTHSSQDSTTSFESLVPTEKVDVENSADVGLDNFAKLAIYTNVTLESFLDWENLKSSIRPTFSMAAR